MSPIRAFSGRWATEEMTIRRAGMPLEKVGALSWFGSDLGLVTYTHRRLAEPGEVLMGSTATEPGDVVDTVMWVAVTLEQVNELIASASEFANAVLAGAPIEESYGRFDQAIRPLRP